MAEVSVVMPFRDAAETIRAAAESLLAQRGLTFEVIAVDDGSRDGSAEILRSLDDPRLRVVENRGAPGVVGAAETGRALASAPWIARMDADDLSHPDRLATQLARARAADAPDGVVCGVRLIEACGEGMARYVDWVNGLVGPEEISRARFVESPIVNPATLLRRESLERAGGYRDVRWAEDHDLWLRMLEEGARFVRVPEVLLDWRDSPSRLTRWDPRYGEEARMAMRCHYLARLPGVAAGGVAIAGAGPIGKGLARGLREVGVEVRGFFEVNPRRIGERIHGLPVAGSGEMGHRWRESVLLGAVGVPGGRERVRCLAEETGRREGEDFWSVC